MGIRRIVELIVLIVLIIITAYFYAKAKKEAAIRAKEQEAKGQPEQKEYVTAKIVQTVRIDGMMCQKCAARVTEALAKFGDVSINLDEKTATIISSELADAEEIESVVTELGYKFEGMIE